STAPIAKTSHLRDWKCRQHNNPSQHLNQILTLLEKGLCWRVGLGSQISIRRDAWIPGSVDFKKQTETEDEIVQFILGYVNELDELNRRLLVRRVVGEQWRPPEVSKVKINFDATFHKQTFAVEALVFAQTTQFGLDLGIERVVIEGDSL
ncbi:hypothetical protein Goarm_018538, partial [Gossypium armourianum]|nr:hypothetical protein [Gossypium armourianum]